MSVAKTTQQMAFGFSPKHIQDLSLDELTPEHFLTVAIEVARKLGWDIGYVSATGFTAYTKFSMSSYGEEITINVDEKTANLKSECVGNQMVDWGKNKSNIEQFVITFHEINTSLIGAQLTLKLQELKSNLALGEEGDLHKTPATAKEKIKNFLAIFKPTKGYFITPIVINLNLLVFILMVANGANAFMPDNESLIRWGANFRPATMEGEWWRLLTNCFLHIGILHLLLNLYALIYIGLLLEPHLGRARFAAAYLLTGIAASMASLWWHDFTVSAGASGAIFGLYGVFLAMLTTNLIDKAARKALLTSIGLFVAYNLIYGLKGGIDNAAHVGGLITGLLIGYAFYPSLRNFAAIKLKYSIIGLLTVLIFTTSFVIYRRLPNHIAEYEKQMEEFSSLETKALGIYSMSEYSPKEDLLAEIKYRGIHNWNAGILLLSSVDQMDLPDLLHGRNKELIRYCNLRIKSYNLLYKAIEENSTAYQDSIAYYNQTIEQLIEGLKQ